MTSLWAAVSPLGRLRAESGRKGSPSTQIQTQPFTPACHHAVGNTVVQTEEGTQPLSMYPFMESQFIDASYVYSKIPKRSKESEYFCHIKKKHPDTLLLPDEKPHDLPFLKSSDHIKSLYLYLSNKRRAGQREEPLSDKKTKIYPLVVLSHKVEEICSYCEVGWSRVRAPEKPFPVRELKCWVYCLLA